MILRRGDFPDLSFEECTTLGLPSGLDKMNLEDASGNGFAVNVNGVGSAGNRAEAEK